MTIFWLIAMVAILAFCQTIWYSRRALNRVSYERRFSRSRVYAGDSLEMVEVLTNDKLLPLPWVRVESKFPARLRFDAQENLDISMDSFHKSLFFMGPYKRLTRRHRLTALHRGYYDCGSVSITAGDLLGLATQSRDLRGEQAKVLVYPRLSMPEEMPVEALEWQGEISVRRWIDPDPILVSGIRDYMPGDSRRDVHWAATARTGKLQVKIRDYTVSPRLLVLFNAQITENLWAAMEPYQIEHLETGVNISAALCTWAANQGMEVGFRSNGGSCLSSEKGDMVSVDPGQGMLEAVLEAMAVLEIKMQKNFMRLLDEEIDRRTQGMDILCVSAYWSAELERRAALLRRMGNTVVHIPIPGGEG